MSLLPLPSIFLSLSITSPKLPGPPPTQSPQGLGRWQRHLLSCIFAILCPRAHSSLSYRLINGITSPSSCRRRCRKPPSNHPVLDWPLLKHPPSSTFLSVTLSRHPQPSQPLTGSPSAWTCPGDSRTAESSDEAAAQKVHPGTARWSNLTSG